MSQWSNFGWLPFPYPFPCEELQLSYYHSSAKRRMFLNLDIVKVRPISWHPYLMQVDVRALTGTY
jgi:hypothetical protein